MTTFGELREVIAAVHDPARPYEQRMQAEAVLASFKRRDDSAAQAAAVLETQFVPLLASAAAPQQLGEAVYVAWTALDVLEYFAEFRAAASAANVEAARRVRAQLFAFLTIDKVPGYLRTKAAKAYAQIAKSCYPAHMPDFFDQLLDAVGAAELQPRVADAALRVLTVCAEELCTAQQQQMGAHSVSALESRARELRQLMLALAPRVLAVLAAFVQRVLTTAPAQHALAADALLCVRQYFTWTPLDAVFATQPSVLQTLHAVLRLDALRPAVLECFAELLGQVYVPTTPAARASLASIFDSGVLLAQYLCGQPPAALSAMEDSDALGKAIQFLLLLLRSLRRVPGWASTNTFLAALVKLTTLLPSASEQMHCLEGLSAAFEDLLARIADEEEDALAPAAFGGAAGAGGAAAEGSALRMRAECEATLLEAHRCAMALALWVANKERLASFDDASPTYDQGESELGMYIAECLNCAAMLAEIYPDKLLAPTATYILEATAQLAAPAQNYADKLNQFRDAVTMLSLGARMAELFVDRHFDERLAMARALFVRTLDVVEWAYKANFAVTFAAAGRSSATAMALHARLYSTLTPWFRWLNELCRSNAQGELEADQYSLRLLSVTLVPFLEAYKQQQQLQQQLQQPQQPPQQLQPPQQDQRSMLSCPCVAHAVATAFRSLAFTLRTKSLPFHKLAQEAYTQPALLLQLGADTRNQLVLGLVALLALPCACMALAQQNWEARAAACNVFLAPHTQKFVQLAALVCGEYQRTRAPLPPAAAEQLAHSLDLLQTVAKAVREQGTTAKRVVYPPLAQTVPAAVGLCDVCKDGRGSSTLLRLVNYLGTIFDSFPTQVIGPDTIQSAVEHLIVTVGSSDDVLPRLMSNPHADTAAVSSVCALLEMLRTMAHELAAYPKLAARAVWFLFDRVFALSKAYNHPHDLVLREAVRLTAALLKWQRKTMLQQPWLDSTVAVLHAGLESRDPQAFHDVTRAVEEYGPLLAASYPDPATAMAMVHAFATTLANAVVTKTHELRRDEAIAALAALVSVNWPAFFDNTLPAFVRALPDVSEPQRSVLLAQFSRQTDLPTFAQNMCTLMNDWNYFVKANAANSNLPASAPLYR